jgi:hypothetical protein
VGDRRDEASGSGYVGVISEKGPPALPRLERRRWERTWWRGGGMVKVEEVETGEEVEARV